MLSLFLLTFSNSIFSRKQNKCIVSKFCYMEIVIIVITAGVGIINFLTIPWLCTVSKHITTDMLLTIAIHCLMLGSLQAIGGRREERSVYQGRVNKDLSGGSLNQILEFITPKTMVEISSMSQFMKRATIIDFATQNSVHSNSNLPLVLTEGRSTWWFSSCLYVVSHSF